MHRISIAYAAPSDRDEFDRRYAEEHVPLAQRLPGLRRYTLTRPRGEGAPHLVAELWFDTAEDLRAALTSPEMAEAAAHAQTLGAALTSYTGEVVEVS